MTSTPNTNPALLKPGLSLDRWVHAELSPMTHSVSGAVLHTAFDDWLTHLSHNPAEQLELAQKAMQILQQFASYLPRAAQAVGQAGVKPLLKDRRFFHPSWQTWSFNTMSQSFLLTQRWWQDATNLCTRCFTTP
jgi:polyhydroxyalkanoate synthase